MDYAQLQAEIAKANRDYEAASKSRVTGQQGLMATYGQDTAGMKAAADARDSAIRAYNSSQSSAVKPSPSPTPQAPPPPPAPVLQNFRPMTVSNKNFKVAPSDIIIFNDDAVEIALIQDLLYEDIGATELSNISRSDLIDGQETIYAPIKNLPAVRREWNPNTIVSTAYGTDFFSRFAIDLSARGVNNPYFDEDGNLVVEIDDVQDDEEIQVQFLSDGTIDLVDDL